MNDCLISLSLFQQKLLGLIQAEQDRLGKISDEHVLLKDDVFNELAIELAILQRAANPLFDHWLQRSSINLAPDSHWKMIPSVPTEVFKIFDWSCIPEEQRTRVFYSSGTTGKDSSRHWHHEKSLELYEKLLLAWHREHPPWDQGKCRVAECLFLTPSGQEAENSSLVHMFSTIASSMPDGVKTKFLGTTNGDQDWVLPFDEAVEHLSKLDHPVCLFGTAFLFVHLLDFLEETGMQLSLPKGSIVFETGGYKGKSRTLTKQQLYQEIESKIGVSKCDILCEYGMSELSSQAYDLAPDTDSYLERNPASRRFKFPPWARCCVISPETKLEVAYGETGMVQVTDLANVWSSVSVITEDIAIRHPEGFELLGRSNLSEPRGCSLMSDDFDQK